MPTVKEGFVQEIIGRYDGDPGMLIPMMQDLQAEYGYLPPEELKRLSKDLGVPLTRVYGVAMFYASFRLAPKGQHEVTLCMGTVCYLKGAPRISEAICSEYGIQPGGTTPDRLFTLQAVNCVGACALAPVMIVDGKYYDGVTPDSVLDVLRELAVAAQGPEAAEPPRPAAAMTAPANREQPAASPAAPAPATAPKPPPEPAPEAEQPGAPASLSLQALTTAVAAPEAQAASSAAAKPPARAPKRTSTAGAKAGAAGTAKARPVQGAKPSSAKAEKPAQPRNKASRTAAPKRGAKGAKKGGRR